jgi:hypothetical protein
MEILGKIRRMYLGDNLTLHEIAKQAGLSRNTIRSWLRSAEKAAPPTYRRTEGPGKLTALHASLALGDSKRGFANFVLIPMPRVRVGKVAEAPP